MVKSQITHFFQNLLFGNESNFELERTKKCKNADLNEWDAMGKLIGHSRTSPKNLDRFWTISKQVIISPQFLMFLILFLVKISICSILIFETFLMVPFALGKMYGLIRKHKNLHHS